MRSKLSINAQVIIASAPHCALSDNAVYQINLALAETFTGSECAVLAVNAVFSCHFSWYFFTGTLLRKLRVAGFMSACWKCFATSAM
jgi:hypothetical protein